MPDLNNKSLVVGSFVPCSDKFVALHFQFGSSSNCPICAVIKKYHPRVVALLTPPITAIIIIVLLLLLIMALFLRPHSLTPSI